VYICDYADQHLTTHQREIAASWPAVHVHTRKLDAADETALKEVVADALSRYGRLDVFFANAGVVGPNAVFTDVESNDFMETMRVNSLGYVVDRQTPRRPCLCFCLFLLLLLQAERVIPARAS
jgi:NAD(P)-dependent dehydrogenase (short-subunit alcohol dehydrogenase family)